jgi:hypothetical protein
MNNRTIESANDVEDLRKALAAEKLISPVSAMARIWGWHAFAITEKI